MDVKECIEKIRQADDASLEQLLDQYLPVIRGIEARYHINDFDSDDWLQEGRLALHKAALSYRDDQGTTFGLYFKLVFENVARSHWRKQQAAKRKANFEAQSFDDPDLERQLANYSYYPKIVDELIVRETLSKENLKLSTFEQLVFNGYLQRLNETEISSQVGKPPAAVKGALDRVRRKMRQRLYD